MGLKQRRTCRRFLFSLGCYPAARQRLRSLHDHAVKKAVHSTVVRYQTALELGAQIANL